MTDEAYDHVDPYADGTYGVNYTPASRNLERELHTVYDHQQTTALKFAAGCRAGGITGGELKDFTGWETNAVSRSLSNLLRDGFLIRLKERRGNAHVHVLPAFVDGREILPYQSTAGKQRRAALMEARAAVMGAIDKHGALRAIDYLLEGES